MPASLQGQGRGKAPSNLPALAVQLLGASRFHRHRVPAADPASVGRRSRALVRPEPSERLARRPPVGGRLPGSCHRCPSTPVGSPGCRPPVGGRRPFDPPSSIPAGLPSAASPSVRCGGCPPVRPAVRSAAGAAALPAARMRAADPSPRGDPRFDLVLDPRPSAPVPGRVPRPPAPPWGGAVGLRPFARSPARRAWWEHSAPVLPERQAVAGKSPRCPPESREIPRM
jgi:hypothetical protein